MSTQDLITIRTLIVQQRRTMMFREMLFGEMQLLDKGDVVERTEMTFLDRPLAAKLHKSLYHGEQFSPGFETDWTPGREAENSTGRVSPFDYDSTTEQTFPMLWAEDFVILSVWEKKYSGSIIGTTIKPPMAAVVLDMIALVDFLKSIKEQRMIIQWLTEFVRNNQLRSSLPDHDIDVDWAGRGYIADLFSIVACLECTSDTGPPPFPAGHDSRQKIKLPPSYYARTIPGFGVLIPVQKPVSTAALNPSNSVEQLSARFIQSGPFKLQVTRELAEHLTLDDRNQLRVFQYWGNSLTPGKGLGYNPSLRIYRNHTLRRSTAIVIH